MLSKKANIIESNQRDIGGMIDKVREDLTDKGTPTPTKNTTPKSSTTELRIKGLRETPLLAASNLKATSILSKRALEES